MSTVQKLYNRGLIRPPMFVAGSTQYEVVMGSVAYGVDSNHSDIDIYGFCIPNREVIFPHLNGEIFGFGKQIQRFEQFQQHHVKADEKEYDITIYNIVKYFQLVMENNPNMIDSLFVPQRCVLHITKIGQMVRENRKLFLHKGSWFKLKGYAYSQMHKMATKNPDPDSKRAESIQKYGYDVKYAMHCVRLMNQVEQILIEHDLDLERNREQLKSIRRGEWSEKQVVDYFQKKESELEEVYTKSDLRNTPDEATIKRILLECLEEYYGSLDGAISQPDKYQFLLNDLKELIRRYT
jgi:predicted nucleotidyltransferase